MLPAAAIVYANQMMRFRRSDFERTCQLHSDDIVRDGIARYAPDFCSALSKKYPAQSGKFISAQFLREQVFS